jgi:hypothetical protein
MLKTALTLWSPQRPQLEKSGPSPPVAAMPGGLIFKGASRHEAPDVARRGDSFSRPRTSFVHEAAPDDLKLDSWE